MKSRILAVVAALAVAVLGATAVIRYAHGADRRALADQSVGTVYIAKAAVPPGTSAAQALAQGLISAQRVVAKGIPAGALTALTSALENEVALSPIAAGEVVLADRFGAPAQVVSDTGVPEKKVAISFPLTAPAAVAPYLEKGAHVAIYDTFNMRRPTGQPEPAGAHLSDDKGSVRATGIVLPDVEVIRVDGKPSAKEDHSGSASSASTQGLLITVAVTPAQSVRLVHAIQTGNLYAGLLGNGASVAPTATSDDHGVVGR
jgi:pilus assembly protein CpaB